MNRIARIHPISDKHFACVCSGIKSSIIFGKLSSDRYRLSLFHCRRSQATVIGLNGAAYKRCVRERLIRDHIRQPQIKMLVWRITSTPRFHATTHIHRTGSKRKKKDSTHSCNGPMLKTRWFFSSLKFRWLSHRHRPRFPLTQFLNLFSTNTVCVFVCFLFSFSKCSEADPKQINMCQFWWYLSHSFSFGFSSLALIYFALSLRLPLPLFSKCRTKYVYLFQAYRKIVSHLETSDNE